MQGVTLCIDMNNQDLIDNGKSDASLDSKHVCRTFDMLNCILCCHTVLDMSLICHRPGHSIACNITNCKYYTRHCLRQENRYLDVASF